MKEELVKKAENCLDGFEAYIGQYFEPSKEPTIVDKNSEEYDILHVLNSIKVHIEDLRQDIDRLLQF